MLLPANRCPRSSRGPGLFLEAVLCISASLRPGPKSEALPGVHATLLCNTVDGPMGEVRTCPRPCDGQAASAPASYRCVWTPLHSRRDSSTSAALCSDVSAQPIRAPIPFHPRFLFSQTCTLTCALRRMLGFSKMCICASAEHAAPRSPTCLTGLAPGWIWNSGSGWTLWDPTRPTRPFTAAIARVGLRRSRLARHRSAGSVGACLQQFNVQDWKYYTHSEKEAMVKGK